MAGVRRTSRVRRQTALAPGMTPTKDITVSEDDVSSDGGAGIAARASDSDPDLFADLEDSEEDEHPTVRGKGKPSVKKESAPQASSRKRGRDVTASQQAAAERKKRKTHALLSETERAQLAQHAELVQQVLSRGVLSDTQPVAAPRDAAETAAPCDTAETAPPVWFPGKHLLAFAGSDVIKKGGARKHRYLLQLPMRLALASSAQEGRLGELVGLDTSNPVLYLEFPLGRVKMPGTMVYPEQARIIALHMERRGRVVADDVFDAVLAFPEAYWIGLASDNLSEIRLPWPDELSVKPDDLTYNWDLGIGASSVLAPELVGTMSGAKAKKQKSKNNNNSRNKIKTPRSSQKQKRSGSDDADADDDDADDDDDDDDDDDEVDAGEYSDGSDDVDDGNGGGAVAAGSDDEFQLSGAAAARLDLTQSPARRQPARARRQIQSYVADDDDDEDDDDEDDDDDDDGNDDDGDDDDGNDDDGDDGDE